MESKTPIFKVAKDVRAVLGTENAFLLNANKGTCFVLNTFGSRIWELLEQGKPIDVLSEDILGTYSDVSSQTVKADLESFIGVLLKKELIVPLEE